MSIGRRLAAYRLHHKAVPTDAFQVIPVAPDLLDGGQVADLIAAIGKADLIILGPVDVQIWDSQRGRNLIQGLI